MSEFHIHIDTKTQSKDLHMAARELGFYAHDFSGHPEGYGHFEPTSHSTIKIREAKEFRRKWEELERLMDNYPAIFGYIEGEFIPVDIEIPEKPLLYYCPPDFQVIRRRLDAATGERFRETEFHLVMDWERSDRRVINGLLDAGLYGALLDKKDHQAIVLTMQGTRALIAPLMEKVHQYIQMIGGIVGGSLKEERAIRYRLYNMPLYELPVVVDRVIY